MAHPPAVEPETVYLSVVVRCRNQATGLREVLEALAAQRCSFPWEVTVVDCGSEDDTEAGPWPASD